jgi:hypothetical protein
MPFLYCLKFITFGNPKKYRKYSINRVLILSLVFAMIVYFASLMSYRKIPGVKDIFLK